LVSLPAKMLLEIRMLKCRVFRHDMVFRKTLPNSTYCIYVDRLRALLAKEKILITGTLLSIGLP
jgi:hypothetical protein